jgi:O-acetyl-ADP-ribose deacetylase (regulator of RNase III)
MIAVRIDDLAFVATEAIVWPVNAELRPITPSLRRLGRAAGVALEEQMRPREPLAVGSAVVTGAGDLSTSLLVSAVVMSDSEPVSRESVRRAMTSALQRTVDWQIGDIAVAPFGLGAGNLDPEESAEVMVSVLTEHAGHARFPASVTIVVESEHEERAFTERLAQVAR